MQPYPFLVNLGKFSAILKCIQSPRTFSCDHLYVSVINTVQLKEIKGVIFYGILEFSNLSIYLYICVNLS